jgi:hypothetical protein
MARIDGIAADRASAIAQDFYQKAERAIGNVPEPLRVTAHSEAILQAYMGYERFLARAGRVETRLKSLANLKTAALVGCPF